MQPSTVCLTLVVVLQVVIVPATLKFNDTAFVYITGGGNNNPGVPSELDEDVLVSAIVATTNNIVAGAVAA